MDDKPKKSGLGKMLVERLHDPVQLRFVLCAGVMAAWYFGAYSPLMEKIAATTTKLELDRKRLALATEVEALRAQAAVFDDRLPPRSDPNEFLQYILGGVRAGPLKLVSLTPEKPREAGPFQVAGVKVELEGKYPDIDAFLRWVENDRRMLRVDGLRVDPEQKDNDALKVQLNVLGLMGVEVVEKGKAKDKPRAGASPAKSKASAPGKSATPPHNRPPAGKGAG